MFRAAMPLRAAQSPACRGATWLPSLRAIPLTRALSAVQDLTGFVQGLLQQMQSRFQAMSDAVIGRIDEMGSRIDELEKSIAQLMEQVGCRCQRIAVAASAVHSMHRFPCGRRKAAPWALAERLLLCARTCVMRAGGCG